MSIKSKVIKIKKILLDNKSSNLYNAKTIFGYLKYSETDDYCIYRKPYKVNKILAAYDNQVLCIHKNNLILYPNFANKLMKFKISFNEKNFPGLIPGSSVDLCAFLPYMREVSKSRYVKVIRLVVITNKGQIYHNFPARGKEYEATFLEEDVLNFEESVVWDLETAKFPSQNIECECFERYYPGLPDENYRFHPMLNTDPKFKDKFNNGGFGKSFTYLENGRKIILPRFYVYSRHPEANSFHFIGSTINDSKMNIIGTYRSNRNVGVRVCIFTSSDGGRSWFCKYEFADSGDYEFIQGDENTWGHNYGNAIVNYKYNLNYKENSLKFKKRELLYDQTNKFNWSNEILISKIMDANYLTFWTKEKHNLVTGNIISLLGEDQVDSNLKWLLNNDVNSLSCGNNLLFKVKVLDENTFELRECVSQSTHNVCCRHIHHINRVKDGWLIGTGEIYPNGWVLYAQMKESDTFSIKHSYESLDIYKLTSDKLSVQRTMGMILCKDEKHVIFASDHDTLELVANESLKKLTGLGISHSSTGVFIGDISNLNNRNNFECIFDAKEPCFFFQKLNGVLVFCGQRGEIAFSFDDGKTWKQDYISSCFMNHYGSIGNTHFFDNYIIRFKK